LYFLLSVGEIGPKDQPLRLSRRHSRSRAKRSHSVIASPKSKDVTRTKADQESAKTKNQKKFKNISRTTSPIYSVSISMSPEGKQSPRSASTSPSSWMPNSSRRSSPTIILSPRDSNISNRKSVTFSRENSPNNQTTIEEDFQQNDFPITASRLSYHGHQKQDGLYKHDISNKIPPLMLRENSPSNLQPIATQSNSPGIRQSISPKVNSPFYRQSTFSREQSPCYQEPISPDTNGLSYRQLIPKVDTSQGYREPLSPTENSQLQQIRLQPGENTLNYRHTMSPRKSSPNYGLPFSPKECNPNFHQQSLARGQSLDYQHSVSAGIDCAEYPVSLSPGDEALGCYRQQTLLRRSRNSASYNAREAGSPNFRKVVNMSGPNTTKAVMECISRNPNGYSDHMIHGDEALTDSIHNYTSPTFGSDVTNPIPVCDTYV